MKILCAFGKHNYGMVHRGIGYEYANFLPALRNLGHQVDFFELWDRSSYENFADLNRKFLEKIRLFKPELVLCVTMTTELWIETLEIVRCGSRTVLIHWNTDDSWKYESCSRLIASGFDLMVTTYKSAIEKSERDGFGHFVLSQWAANSKNMEPALPASACRYNVSFVGSAYGNRLKWIEALRERGVEVTCFGFGWPNGPVAADDIPRIIRESVVSLNFGDSGFVINGMRVSRSRQVKARVFEVPGSGGLLLTEGADCIESFYCPDKEIIVFDNVESLLDAIRAMNVDHVRRDSIARAGYLRTANEHTYEKRFEPLIAEAVAIAQRKTCVPESEQIDMVAFEKVAERHHFGLCLKMVRTLVLLPCLMIWGRKRGPRAARRLLFELSWRLVGVRCYCATGWPGLLFYSES